MNAGVRKALSWTLALAAYGALADVCVETFAAGSPLRLLILIVAVAFGLVTALLWNLSDAVAKAQYVFICLAAFVAYAGASVGLGNPGGIRAFGQSTSVVAAALLIVALACSAGGMLPLRRINAWIRGGVAVVLLYAIVPLAASLRHGGLTAALDGSVVGGPSPFWIRGAFIASEVLLPLTALGFAAASIVWLVKRRPRRAAAAVRVAIAALLAVQIGALEAVDLKLPSLASFERPNDLPMLAVSTVAAPTTAPNAAVAGATPATSGAAKAEATAASDAHTGGGIGASLGETVLDASDALSSKQNTPRQRVEAFEQKVAIAETYVRHEDFDPVALAATLPAEPKALFEYVRDAIAPDSYAGAMRGAKGTLMSRAGNADDKALLLVALLKAKSIPARLAFTHLSASDAAELEAAAEVSPLAAQAAPVPDAFYKDLGLVKERVEKASTAREVADASYARAGVAFADEHAPELQAAVANAGLQSSAAAKAPATNAAKTHAFVQASVGGRFVDLDPSLARSQMGSHLGGNTLTDAATLPAERIHTVRARFVLAYGTGAERVETIALDRTMRSSEVAGVPISMGISSPDVSALNQVAVAKSFVPYIDVGTDVGNGSVFALRDREGRPLDSVRLEIETAGPGVAGETNTRVLWDSSSRAEPALAISHNYEMLVVSGALGQSFSNAMVLATVSHMRPLLIYAATPPAQRVLPAVRDLEPAYPVTLIDYVNRDLRIAEALRTASPSVRFTFARPGILMLSNGFERVGRDVRGTTAFDIVQNGARAVAADPTLARMTNIKRGMLDTYLEQHVLSFLNHTASGTPQAFAEAKNQHIATTLVTSKDSLPAGIPTQSAGALLETVSHGEVALAMRGPADVGGTSHYAWWAIDPVTGDTVGRMDNGAGDALVEDSLLLFYAKRVGMAFTLLGIVIGGPQSVEDFEIGMAAGGLGLVGEAIGALKSIYDLSGGSYGQGGGSGESQTTGGQSQSGTGGEGGTSNSAPEPGTGGSSPGWGPWAPVE